MAAPWDQPTTASGVNRSRAAATRIMPTPKPRFSNVADRPKAWPRKVAGSVCRCEVYETSVRPSAAPATSAITAVTASGNPANAAMKAADITTVP